MDIKFRSFGFYSKIVDGHNFDNMFEEYKKSLKTKKPKAFICKTIKGKGISFMEDDNNWHYKIPNKEEVEKVKKELGLS